MEAFLFLRHTLIATWLNAGLLFPLFFRYFVFIFLWRLTILQWYVLAMPLKATSQHYYIYLPLSMYVYMPLVIGIWWWGGVTYIFPSSSSSSRLLFFPGSEEIKITTGCSQKEPQRQQEHSEQVGWLNTSDFWGGQARKKRERVSQSVSQVFPVVR